MADGFWPGTDSTNAEAVRIAPGLSGPEWILALEQTARRGRRGRGWVNPKGNFAATLVMHPGETPDKVALRSFVAALSLYDALVAATGRAEPFSLKWPNDVLLNGGKMAGILLESAGSGGRLTHFAIGLASTYGMPPTRRRSKAAPCARCPFCPKWASISPRRVSGPVGTGLCPLRGAVHHLRVRTHSHRLAGPCGAVGGGGDRKNVT